MTKHRLYPTKALKEKKSLRGQQHTQRPLLLLTCNYPWAVHRGRPPPASRAQRGCGDSWWEPAVLPASGGCCIRLPPCWGWRGTGWAEDEDKKACPCGQRKGMELIGVANRITTEWILWFSAGYLLCFWVLGTATVARRDTFCFHPFGLWLLNLCAILDIFLFLRVWRIWSVCLKYTT